MATARQKERSTRADQDQRTPGDPAPLDLQPGVGVDNQPVEGGGASVAELVGQLDGAVDGAEQAAADLAAAAAEDTQDDQPEAEAGDGVTGDEPQGEALTDAERAQLAEHVATLTGTEGEPEAGTGDGAEDTGPQASGDTPDGDAAGAEPAETTGKGKGRGGRQPKAAAAPKPPKQERVAKQPGLCVHGCGQMCQRPQAKFVRGHDSLLAQELRAAYANGERTADQIREHAGLISDKFLGKINRSIAAVDAERTQTEDAARARKELIKESVKVAKARA